jgi:hypothetical protein
MVKIMKYRLQAISLLLVLFTSQAFSEGLRDVNVPPQLEMQLLDAVPDHPVYSVRALVRVLDCLRNCEEIIRIGQETELQSLGGKNVKPSSLQLNKAYDIAHYNILDSQSKLASDITFTKNIKEIDKLVFKKPRLYFSVDDDKEFEAAPAPANAKRSK